MSFNLTDLFPVAIKASFKGGIQALKVFDCNYEIHTKEDESPVTEADHLSNQAIEKTLSSVDASIPIVSEESPKENFEKRKSWKACWIVDPLDGTQEFINKSTEFGVMVALAIGSLVKIGAIYLPKLDTLYAGCEGEGSFKLASVSSLLSEDSSDSQIRTLLVSAGKKLPLQSPPKTFTLFQSKSHLTEKDKEYYDSLSAQHANLRVLRTGSCLKYCFLAEGLAHEYTRFQEVSEWDIAAGQAIIEWAGGKLVDLDSKKALTYNRPHFRCPAFKATMPW